MTPEASNLIGQISTLLGSAGGIAWLHRRSVQHGEDLRAAAARLDAHDQEFHDVKASLARVEAGIDQIRDHLLNGGGK